MPTAIPKNLDTLSFKQLTALQVQIEDLKNKRHDQAVTQLQTAEAKYRADMAQKLAKMATELGVKPETVPQFTSQNGQHKGRKAVKAKAKIAPKYMDKADPANTWTGRGRAPRWLAAYEAKGTKRDEFRIGA